MRSLFGLVLLIAGLGLGAYSYFPETAEEHIGLVQLSRYVIPVAHDPAGAETASPLLTISANSPLFGSPAINQVTTSDAPPVVVAHQQLVRPSGNSDAIIPALSGSGPLSAPHPSASALDLQQELKRVGCYHGYLDGDWGPASRRAMQAFLTKVNASLPVDQPDDILLALLRSQPDGACTNGCPAGQVEGEGGRCTSSVIAGGNAAGQRGDATALIKPSRFTNSGAKATSAPLSSASGANDDLMNFTPASRSRPELPGRMSIGGPLMAQSAGANNDMRSAALPDLKPASEAGNALETASITPSEPITETAPSASSEARPRPKTAKKRYSSRKRYGQKVRQKRLMRQAFGEYF